MPERFKVTKADETNAELALKDEESAMGHLLDEKKGKEYILHQYCMSKMTYVF